ncbi:MAG: ABC transporter permease [Dehalococcoidia bacterium]|nr:ABC transporter permease [Dehalococcoidia bacterium]MDZ4246365.1 ABC transporter permease [Dehalococcoidia bacterium]
MRQRILSIIVKEFIQLRRDRRTLGLIIFLPVVQLLIFGYALSTEVNNIPTVVWDASNTARSRSLVDSFRNTEYFDIRFYASSYDEVARHIDGGTAKLAVVIPPDYALRIDRRETAKVQFFVDGSDPNTGIIAISQANLVTGAMNIDFLVERLGGRKIEPAISLEPRVWYNPSMEAVAFNVPGLIGVVLQMITVLLTSFAIVRERETGTIEQLLTSPIKSHELIIGKLVPYIIIAYADVILILIVATAVFKMPFHGSVILLLALSSVFLMFSLGIGILISTVSKNQFQAMQMTWGTQIPAILLSGFIFPVDSMPRLAQWISYLIPLTYYLRIIRGIILKGVGIEYLWRDVAILGGVGIITLFFSIIRLRKTLD